MKYSKKYNPKKTQPKIAIIGGGPMGLGISYQLAKYGYKSVIYEADDRLGGMAASFDFNGLKIERYYHFHCLSDKPFFKLLEELNLEKKIKWKKTKMGFFYENNLYDWGSPISVLKFNEISIISRLRYLFHALRCISIKKWNHLDKVNATFWLKKWLGKEAFNILWSKLLEYKFYKFKDDISAAWIWSRIRRLGLSRKNFRETLGFLDGGSYKWISKLEKKLLYFGVKINLCSAVKNISLENNSIKLLSSIPFGFVLNINEVAFNSSRTSAPNPASGPIIARAVACMPPALSGALIETLAKLNPCPMAIVLSVLESISI